MAASNNVDNLFLATIESDVILRLLSLCCVVLLCP